MNLLCGTPPLNSYAADQTCDCPHRNPLDHSPTRIAMSRNPKDDFVPLESVLEDVTDSVASTSHQTKNCCVHGMPCVLAKSRKHHSHPRRRRSSSKVVTDDGSSGNHSRDNTCKYFVEKGMPSMKETAYQKVKIDQSCGAQFACKHKTRWPAIELMNGGNSSRDSSKDTSERQESDKSDKLDSAYDYLDVSQGADTDDSGQRKTKKTKDNYPKLEGVLEDTGYIELKVSSEPDSRPPSKGPKSSRRKDKKKKGVYSSIWSDLPYADVGFLQDKRASTPSSSQTRSLNETSDEEQLNLSSNLEMVCRYYMGHKLRSEAEKGEFAADSFTLYHRVPDWNCDFNELKKCIRLYILYVTPLKNFQHYAILKRNNQYSVECDDKLFPTLSELIRFYASKKTFFGNGNHMQRFPGN